jgi:acyl carrier protein
VKPDDALDGIIRSALELPDDADLTDIRYRETASWDSLAHLRLLLAIEEGYGLTLDGDDLPTLTDYAALRNLVGRRGG